MSKPTVVFKEILTYGAIMYVYLYSPLIDKLSYDFLWTSFLQRVPQICARKSQFFNVSNRKFWVELIDLSKS